MGNKLQLPNPFSSFQSPIISHSYQQLKQKVQLINIAFKQNKCKLMMCVELKISTVRYEKMNWKNSTVRGTVSVRKRVGGSLREDKGQQEEWKSQEIVLAYDDVNLIHEEMKNLDSKPQKSKTLTTTQTSSTIQTNPTPTFTQPDQCCICFQHTPSMVLPCSHAFCDNCTVKYIIEAQQKKCPQCRQQIKGSRESVEKQIFTLVQDQEVYQQVRVDVLHVISNFNPRVVVNFQHFLKDN